jgi:hypothetical protein
MYIFLYKIYKMSLLCSLYVAILFFLLTPGVLLRIPKGGSKYAVAGLHALIFGVILYLTRRFVWRLSASLEGFDATTGDSTPEGEQEEDPEKKEQPDEVVKIE